MVFQADSVIKTEIGFLWKYFGYIPSQENEIDHLPHLADQSAEIPESPSEMSWNNVAYTEW